MSRHKGFIKRLLERTLYSIAELVQSSTWLKSVALEVLRILRLDDVVIDVRSQTEKGNPRFSQFVHELFPAAGLESQSIETCNVWLGRISKSGEIEYSLIKSSGSSNWFLRSTYSEPEDSTESTGGDEETISNKPKPELTDLVVVSDASLPVSETLTKKLVLAHLSVSHLSIASVHSTRSRGLPINDTLVGHPSSGLVWVEGVKLINPGFFTIRYELLQLIIRERKGELTLIGSIISSVFEHKLEVLVGVDNFPENNLRTVDRSFAELSSNLATRFHLPLLHSKQRLEVVRTLLFKDPSRFLGSAMTLQINGVQGGGVKSLAGSFESDSTARLSPGRQAMLLSCSDSELIEIDLAAPFDPWCETDPRLSLIFAEVALALEIEKVRFEHFLFISPGTVDAITWLGIEAEFVAHDFYLLCPSPHLLDDKLEFCRGKCTPGNGSCQTVGLITKQDTFANLKNNDVHVWRRMWGPRIDKLSRVIFLSKFTEGQFVDVYPKVNSQILTQKTNKTRFRDEFPGFSGGGMRVVLAGDIAPHKGALLFRNLLPAMTKMGIEFTALGRVWIGTGRDGLRCIPYNGPDELKQLIAKIKPHLALIPSRAPETFSLVLSEMWESGIPVLASRIGALEERINQHGGGFLVDDYSSPEAWESALREIMSDPTLLETAHQEICNRYKSEAL